MATTALTKAKKSRLTKQARFAGLLATGMSARAAGKAVGVAKSTANDWANDVDVIATRRSIEQNAVGRARSIISDNSPEAARRLADLAQSENQIVAGKAAVDLLKLAEKNEELDTVPLAYANQWIKRYQQAVETVFGDDAAGMAVFHQEIARLCDEGHMLATAAIDYEADDDVIDSPSPATKTKNGDE
ncbi:hypothetical protein [Neorhodopirellula pilleata]|uniref:Uncharacterized protein n=1 Tax=Neorhodopirellula pilleata TaxID=2714738 RepID=A0A5C5ZQD8_9BACT|nr:hypothetical protein [Neorhodopirellula pilleata]TWT89315.1 hypothetical protein Pla100_56320 [Neorhodopirellula pilleata]